MSWYLTATVSVTRDIDQCSTNRPNKARVHMAIPSTELVKCKITLTSVKRVCTVERRQFRLIGTEPHKDYQKNPDFRTFAFL